MTEKKLPDWAAIEGQYRAGVDSVNAMAAKYGVSEGAVRARAKKHGWSRDPAATKRQIVRCAMAGITNGITNEVIRKTIEQAAADDVADMERGLRISRQCLKNLEDAAMTAVEPKEIKIIVDATAAAIDSIRRIRSLDDGLEKDADHGDSETTQAASEIRRALGL